MSVLILAFCTLASGRQIVRQSLHESAVQHIIANGIYLPSIFRHKICAIYAKFQSSETNAIATWFQ